MVLSAPPISAEAVKDVTVHSPRPLAGEGLGVRAVDSTAYPLTLTLSPIHAGEGTESLLKDTALRTVTDLAGRQVAIPAEIRRIATAGGTPAVNSFVFAIGKGDAIVNGLPLFIRRQPQRWKYQTALMPTLADQPVLAEPPAWTPDLETLALLKPDLSLVVDELNANNLQSKGFPAVVLSWQDPDSARKTMILLGEIFNRQERAAEYQQYFDAVLSRTAAIFTSIALSQRPRALYCRLDNLTQVMGSTARWLIEKAGGVPVPERGEGPNPDNMPFSLEQLLAWNPDVLMVWGLEDVQRAYSDPRLGDLAAVRHHRVHAVPHGVHIWTHYTPEQPLTVLWMAKIFYPELLKNLDVAAETQAFFQRFFDYSLSAAEARAILEQRP